ncbi:MAG: D-sedoheptulose 7-phosphate isomerase [Endomicrobiales bacterium]|nr:D-sedoheptulose 7-phosphate isomerase [Endomicrobiales bacterium]
MKDKIKGIIRESIEAKEKLLSEDQVAVLEKISNKIIEAYNSCRKVIVFGNGGSASDAQHFAAEMICRFEKDRMALPAIALSTNTSSLTSIGNDYSFDKIFSRQVEALAQPGDVVIGISTSGNSPNVLQAIEEAKKLKAVTIGFTGSKDCKLKKNADLCFCAPSAVTGRIQECHILAIHVICKLIEDTLFKDG